MMQNNIQHILENNQLIPVVTFNSLNEIDGIVNKIKNNGINCIEVTLRTPIAFDAIQKLKEDYKNQIAVGVGTVINQKQIEKSKTLNVDFIVCPGISETLASALESSKIAFIPGVSTPSEIIKGIHLGWQFFKFFPAHLFGGIEALKTYGQVFPDVKFCPTGGINENTYKSYLELKNVISVGGSWMVK